MTMKRINIKKGAGEAIGFAVVIPFILFILLFILNVFQVALCEEKLIYAAYKLGRQAVISYSEPEKSDQAMNDVVSSIFNDTSKVDWNIRIRNGVGWVKGNMLQIEVTYDFKGAIGFQNGKHTRTIAMMIEHSYWGSSWGY